MKKSKTTPELVIPNIKDWQAILTIVVLVMIFFRDIIFQKAFFWEDFLYQFYPFRNFAAVTIANGELPLWNPYTFSGTPFQADIQSALFYIPNLLLSFFVSDGKLNFYWLELLIIVHIMLAGVGMYFLAKEFNIQKLFSLVSGLVFALSGFMITHVIHQVMICQVAWLPIILLFFKRALTRSSFLYAILCGLLLGHAVLAGFPQLSLYIFFFLFLYFVFELIFGIKPKGFKTGIRTILIATLIITIAISFTAIQILPTLELAPLSQRAEITYEKSQEGQLTWEQLVTMIVPKFFGSSGAQGSTYWGSGVYWVYWETCFYVGITTLILILFTLFSVKKDRYWIFFIGVSLFAILYALGDNFFLHKLFFNFVPGFDKFRSIGRMTLLSTFSFSLLSGFGLQEFFNILNVQSNKIKKILMISSGILVLLWLSVMIGFLQPTDNLRYYNQFHTIAVDETTTALILGLLTIGILFLIFRRTLSPLAGVIGLIILHFIDINIFGFNQNNGSTNPDEYYERTKTLVNIIKQDAQNEYFRVNSRRENYMILDRNQGMIDRIYMMEGYTPLALQRIYPPVKDFDHACDLLNAKYRVSVDEQNKSMHLTTASTFVPRAFFVYRTKIINDEEELKKYMSSESFEPRKVVVFEETPDMILDDDSDSLKGNAEITSYKINSISLKVSTPKNGYLVLSEIFYPGWKAYVDGREKKVYRANWSLRAIPIEAGEHKVDVRFEPKSFYTGAWITFITIGLSSIGIVYSLLRKKRNNI